MTPDQIKLLGKYIMEPIILSFITGACIIYLVNRQKQKLADEKFQREFSKALRTLLLRIDEVDDKGTKIFLMYDIMTNKFLGQSTDTVELYRTAFMKNPIKETLVVEFSNTGKCIEVVKAS